MSPTEREEALVGLIKDANLPELDAWAIESLGAQVDLDDDQLDFAVSTLLIAQTGADLNFPGGDSLQIAFVAVVPGSDQQLRRQQALEGLSALRTWLSENTAVQPTTLRTERLHPVVVMGLFATCIG